MKAKHFINFNLTVSVLVAFCLMILLTTCKGDLPVPTQEAAEAAVMEKIQAANSKWASEDPLGFYENAAENIVWIDDIGSSKRVIGREELKPYLEGFKGVVPPHKHELYDFYFQHLGDIVIANYYYQGTLEGEKAPPWKAVSIFKYSDGDWSSVHENWTLVVEETSPEEKTETEQSSVETAE